MKIVLSESLLPDDNEKKFDFEKEKLAQMLHMLSYILDMKLFMFKMDFGLNFVDLQKLVKEFPEDQELKNLVQVIKRLKRIQKDFPREFKGRDD